MEAWCVVQGHTKRARWPPMSHAPRHSAPHSKMRRGTDVVACTGCVRFSLGDVESVDEGGQQRVAAQDGGGANAAAPSLPAAAAAAGGRSSAEAAAAGGGFWVPAAGAPPHHRPHTPVSTS